MGDVVGGIKIQQSFKKLQVEQLQLTRDDFADVDPSLDEIESGLWLGILLNQYFA